MIRYTNGARVDVDEAISWLVERNAVAADRLGARLKAGIDRFERFLELGGPGRVVGTRE